ncbi:hypothetical protein [Chitinophaga vietnamensis]|uniref:hypothetical protein n=1 Tax=Chitinophaga vietnamensis TaxID=2593957 RepID=UPI001177D005|nr:hypothetical protein [Chitinophaga vietnamensis]
MKHAKIKVKVTCFWEDSVSLMEAIKLFSFGTGSWKNIEFVTHDNYDRLIILTHPYPGYDYDPARAITVLTEPPDSSHHIPHASSAVLPVYLALPFWSCIAARHRNKIERLGLRKRELFSAVTSELYTMEGHKRRLELVCLLDHAIAAGFSLWGRPCGMGLLPRLQAYKGEIIDKYQALWNYKYHFACENSFIDNYFTEKFVDPVIAECLCFYDGCTNLESFVDSRAFVRIDVRNPEQALDVIIRSIRDGERAKRIRFVREQKTRLLYHLNPLNIIWMVINEQDVYKACLL